MQWLRKALVGVVLIMAAACTSDRTVEPSTDEASGPQVADQYWCETHPEECHPEIPVYDPDPQADGYFFGNTVSRTACFNSTGAGINDSDYDGMSNHCEEVLADAFSPLLLQSNYDCSLGKEPYHAVKHFPNDVNDPTGGVGSTVRIFYALSYYYDCGDPGNFLAQGVCAAFQGVKRYVTFNGFNVGSFNLTTETKNICDPHFGDSEFIIVDVVYNEATQHWATKQVFTSAHWDTFGDQSRWTRARNLQWADKVGGYPKIYVALYKHANYPSRSTCEGSYLPDNCMNITIQTRVRAAPLYNLGSRQHNLINQGSCVMGGELLQYYPELYRQECYWTYDNFRGWDRYDPGVTGYRTSLLSMFECKQYVVEAFDIFVPGQPFTLGAVWSCSSFGVNRKTGLVS
jgi:hypothetical protein